MGKDPSKMFEFKERIGKGSFGEVYRAIDRESKQVVAIKIIDLEKSDGKTSEWINIWSDRVIFQMKLRTFNKKLQCSLNAVPLMSHDIINHI